MKQSSLKKLKNNLEEILMSYKNHIEADKMRVAMQEIKELNYKFA